MAIIRFSSPALAALLPLATISPNLAADLPHHYTDEQVIIEDARGWYLRGDVGYVANLDHEVRYNGSAGHQDFFDEDFDDTWLIGVGVGRYINHFLRWDVTLDYRANWDFEGKTLCFSGCSVSTNAEHGAFDMWALMGNAYLEWDNYSAFTPYVGGGLGLAYVDVSKHFAANGAGTASVFGSKGNWNFAASLMAGVEYEINHAWSLDASYRYLWVGDVESGASQTTGLTGKITYEDLDFHEFRIGGRYRFY